MAGLFTGQMPFLSPNQLHQSTDGIKTPKVNRTFRPPLVVLMTLMLDINTLHIILYIFLSVIAILLPDTR